MRFVPLILASFACHKAPPVAPVPASAPAPAAAPVERALLLWEVERDGAVSHLFGTCHLPIPLASVLPPPHDALLAGARVVVTEIDTQAVDPMEAIRELDGHGASLRAALGPEAWQTTAIRLRGVMPAPMLDRMRPWGAWSVLVLVPQPGAQAGGPILDQAVATGASSGAERLYLETLKDQTELLGGMDAEFLELLRAGGTAGAPTEGTDDEGAVRLACSTGDVTGMERDIAGPDRDPTMEVMFDARNRRWIETLEPELARGGAFVAVGAGHMLGPQGLVALLEGRGFTVRRQTGLAPPTELGQLSAPPPPPVVDAAALDGWKSRLGETLPTLLCAEGNPIRTCFAPEADACRAKVASGLELCLEQHADLLAPADQGLTPQLSEAIGACAMTGMAYDLMLAGGLDRANACITGARPPG